MVSQQLVRLTGMNNNLAARSAATNLSATYSVLFGHIFRVFRPHILCFSDTYPRVSATYALFGHISACFGHIFRAFWSHILLLAAGGLKTDIFKTVFKVFRDEDFQVL
jgi:hypothetical protein